MANARNSVPDASQRLLMQESGRATDVWYSFFQRVGRFIADLQSTQSSLSDNKAAKEQSFAEVILIEAAQDKDYDFVGLQLNGTITSVITKTSSGTCTVTVKINGVELSGSANSASTTKETQQHDADSGQNQITDEDELTVTISSNSSALDVSIAIRGTKTLD